MTTFASSLINWSAIWKICLAALVGGAGVVIVFGFLLLAVDRATSSQSEGMRITSYAVAGICALFVVGAAGAGIYAMAHKPNSKPAKPTKSAQVAPSARARS
jgi:hypothetical protein